MGLLSMGNLTGMKLTMILIAGSKQGAKAKKITEALLQLNDEVGAQIRWMRFIRKHGFVVSLYGWL